MVIFDDFQSDDPIAWCPGCGNHQILEAFKKALVESGKRPEEIVIVSGIGQAAKLPHYLRCNAFNGLHGRTLPVATGIKLAKHELTVIAEGGDGDGYTEGGNHFLHAVRRNLDITYLVHNNQVYGLTKGQTSPTSDLGYVSKTTPMGSLYPPMNPLMIAIASNGSFVARGFSGEVDHLTFLIEEGLRHKGFAFIDILQPCVSFNKVNTFQWYKKRVYNINETRDYDYEDRLKAFERSQEWGDRIPIGILYKKERTTRQEENPVLKNSVLVNQRFHQDAIDNLLQTFR